MLLKLHSNCIFLVIFVIIIIKITIIIIIIIIAAIIYHHWKQFWSYAQNIVFDVRKKRTKLPELGGWGRVGDSGNGRKKTFVSLLMSSLTCSYFIWSMLYIYNTEPIIYITVFARYLCEKYKLCKNNLFLLPLFLQ